MARLKIAMADYNYKETHRQLKEQFIHGLKDNRMIIEIICELTAMKDTSAVTSKWVPAQARLIEAQRSQTAILDSVIEKNEVDMTKLERVKQKV